MALGNTLTELRKKAKLTQSELGEKLSISAQAISKWENNLSEPDIDTLKKLANIYGVSISDILGESKDVTELEEAPANAPIELYDVYLTSINPDADSNLVELELIDVLGIDTDESDYAVRNLPYLITGNASIDKCKQITEYFSKYGATVVYQPAKGNNPHRKVVLDAYSQNKDSRPTTNMHKRFIVANVTAAIPAIALMILFLSLGGGVLDVLFSIYCGVALYSLIFLAWYPTFTRRFFAPINNLISGGIFGFIFACLLMLPWILAALIIAPINYIFAIKTRIKRMKEEDYYDDIFLNPYYLK